MCCSTYNSSIKNARNRARKHGAERLDAVTKALCLPLRDCVDGYKRELRRLHPFERVVADLTARAREKRDGLTLMDVLVCHSIYIQFSLFSFSSNTIIG